MTQLITPTLEDMDFYNLTCCFADGKWILHSKCIYHQSYDNNKIVCVIKPKTTPINQPINTMPNNHLTKTDYAVLATLILGFIALMVLLG